MTRPFFSIIIPAYNEAANFHAGVLVPVIEYLRRQKYSWEVIFVDDGSNDATHRLLAAFCRSHVGCKLMRISHGGKAAAVTAGMLAAKGKYVLFTDFDQSTPLPEISKFLAAHARGADVVIGIRTQTQKDTLFRKLRSKIFVTLVQLIALPGIRDSQCGFKSFTAPVAKRIFSHLLVSRSTNRVTGGYMGAFDVEVLYLARRLNLKIVQVPVAWIKILSDKLNIWTEPLLMIRDILRVRLYDILGKYAGI